MAASIWNPTTPVLSADVLKALANTSNSSQGDALLGVKAEVLNSVGRTQHEKNNEIISVRDFGAIPDGITDNTVALQNAIDACLLSGQPLIVPGNILSYKYNTTLEINYDPSNTKALHLVGESGLTYFGTQKGSLLEYTGTGYAISVNGRGVGVGGANSGHPMAVVIKGISFIGTAFAEGAIKFNRAWFGKIKSNNFYGFSKATGGVVTIAAVAGGGNAFCGEIDVTKNHFAGSGRCVLLTGTTGGVINVLRIKDNIMLDQQYGIAHDFGSDIPYALNCQVLGNHFEGTIISEVYSQGVAANWVIRNNYFEQNNNTENAPRVDIAGVNNSGIIVAENTFSKSLQAAGQSLVRIANCAVVQVTGNTSNYGGAIDRYSVELISCSAAEVEPMAVSGGASFYPVLINNVVIFSGRVTDQWRKIAVGGSGNFVGISSGDGYPGGTVCTTTNEYNKTNGRVSFNFKATITTKSGSGTSSLIGVLPFTNSGNEVIFPVYTTNVTGTAPFYARLPAGQSVATIYDATGVALNYQTSMSVGSVVEANFSYLTQS